LGQLPGIHLNTVFRIGASQNGSNVSSGIYELKAGG